MMAMAIEMAMGLTAVHGLREHASGQLQIVVAHEVLVHLVGATNASGSIELRGAGHLTHFRDRGVAVVDQSKLLVEGELTQRNHAVLRIVPTYRIGRESAACFSGGDASVTILERQEGSS
jgi:hypothetical protein